MTNMSFTSSMANFVVEVQKWNRDVFGNIFKKKKRLIACIGGIQKALETHNSRNLELLECQLMEEFEVCF